MSGLVDFHCHLDLFPDPASAVADAEAAGVNTLTVTTTPRAWAGNQHFIAKARHVRAALGLHPQVVGDRANEVNLWENLLKETRFVGEVGLDAGPKFYSSFSLQKEVFERILCKCAEAGNKVLTVHSVRAAKEVLNLIEAHLPPERGKIVLHWFTGSRADLRRAVEMGCYFSVNEPMAGSDTGRKLIADIPVDRLLTETDAPFTLVNGRASRPTDIEELIPKLAALKGLSAHDLRLKIGENLHGLCGDW